MCVLAPLTQVSVMNMDQLTVLGWGNSLDLYVHFQLTFFNQTLVSWFALFQSGFGSEIMQIVRTITNA